MDPDANLEEQLRLAAEITDKAGGPGPDAEEESLDDRLQRLEDLEGKAYRLAELVEALNGWIAKGGALPKRWACWYEVRVSNIGAVYQGTDEEESRKVYREYVERSIAGIGRAGGQFVHRYGRTRPGPTLPLIDTFENTSREDHDDEG